MGLEEFIELYIKAQVLLYRNQIKGLSRAMKVILKEKMKKED